MRPQQRGSDPRSHTCLPHFLPCRRFLTGLHPVPLMSTVAVVCLQICLQISSSLKSLGLLPRVPQQFEFPLGNYTGPAIVRTRIEVCNAAQASLMLSLGCAASWQLLASNGRWERENSVLVKMQRGEDWQLGLRPGPHAERAIMAIIIGLI